MIARLRRRRARAKWAREASRLLNAESSSGLNLPQDGPPVVNSAGGVQVPVVGEGPRPGEDWLQFVTRMQRAA